MEQLLHRSSDLSDLAYLRILQLVHIQTSTLVDDLKVYELPNMSSKVTLESDHQRALNGAAGAGWSATTTTVSNMLETALEELFVPYIEGQRYLDRESKNLASMYAELLTNFSRYHVCHLQTIAIYFRLTFHPQDKAQKGKASSYLDRVVNQLSAAAATTSAGGVQSTSAQAANALLRFGGLDRTQDKPDEMVREEDGLLSIDIAERMLKWHAEAVGRCVELTPANDV